MTWPASLIYRLGRSLDRRLRLWHILPRRRLPVPVFCIGNLTVGGTGKTPMVALLAGQLKREGWRVAVLSRGYRAEKPPVDPLIVSDGQALLARAEQAGDESRQLAEMRGGYAIIVHPNRHRSGEVAIRQLGCDLLVLDDGFQHDALERDLDIVLWDLRDDPRRARLLPAGRLREPLSALRRAGAVVLTHAEYLTPARGRSRMKSALIAIKRHAPAVEIFEATTVVTGWRSLSGRHGIESRHDINNEPGARPEFPWTGRKVIAISGLARPGSFEATIRNTGGILMHHFDYDDHHVYEREEVSRCATRSCASAPSWR